MVCGNCKHFKPCMKVPAVLDSYGKCQHHYGGFKGEIRYDYSSACTDHEFNY